MTKEKRQKELWTGIGLLSGFIMWTILIQTVDVQPAGQNGTNIGFAAFNVWFHHIIGVHMMIYTITDWLGLVPIFICWFFGGLGMIQLIRRRSLLRVDTDLILLGVYYVIVILGYLVFEMIPINYRPVQINGVLEASYPSSTTLLVLSVMPTIKLQVDRRSGNRLGRKITHVFVIVFSAFMVIGRLIAGVHWATDIIGSVFLSSGLFLIYRFSVDYMDYQNTIKSRRDERGIQ